MCLQGAYIMRMWCKFCVGAIGLSASGAACASETITYSYDALGRLTAVATSGGPNDGTSVATGFDPAGNRSSYSVSGNSQSMQVMQERTLATAPADELTSPPSEQQD
jgi:hypothetical protein